MKRLLNRLCVWVPCRMELLSGVGVSAASITALPFWRQLSSTSNYWLRRVGWPGVLAIGLLVMCPAFYLSAIRPAQARLDLAQQRAAALQEEASLSSKSFSGARLSTEEQLAEFYRKFPLEWQSPLWLEKLVALAERSGLRLNDGEYKATPDKVGRLVRYQMSLKVQGSYPQIRQFLTDLPGALPIVALENVQFERQKVGDPDVDARIKLMLYLGQTS